MGLIGIRIVADNLAGEHEGGDKESSKDVSSQIILLASMKAEIKSLQRTYRRK